MGPNRNLNKTPDAWEAPQTIRGVRPTANPVTPVVDAAPWENDPIVDSGNSAAPWENDPIVGDTPQSGSKLDANDIDPNLEAPARVRAEVGALSKPEDRLRTVRKFYPNAEPLDDDNFIMTDPKTGKTMIYNQPGWLPSGGDFASILPEIGEGVGSVGGAIGGAVGGGAVGSALPVVGTAAGVIAGGAAGAGAGATAGREATQRGLNWYFGNEDTRTTGEQIGDAAKTFGLNAGGELLGAAAAPLLGKAVRGTYDAVKGGSKRIVAGTADDAALAGQRAADLRAIGAEPTAGMVNGNANTALREQGLAATRAGKPIQDRIGQAFDSMDNEFNRVVGGITPQTLSRQELGQALKDQSAALKTQIKTRGDDLYGRVGELTGDAPVAGSNTRNFLEQLQTERKAMGKSTALNQGPAVDNAVKQTKAIVDDLGKGVNFNSLKDMRTQIGSIANDHATDAVLRERMQGLYSAMTKDMAETAGTVGDNALRAWRKANNYYYRNKNPESIFSTKGSIDPIIKAQTPEQAADWVLAQVNKGGTRLNAVRRQIERTEGGSDLWNTLAGSTVERMGITRGVDGVEAFAPTQMLNQWKKLAPEAKDAMFHGTNRAQFRQDLDRLARVADNLKQYRRLDNHSNTNKAASALGELNLFDTKSLLGGVLGGPKAWAGMAAGKGARYGMNRWQAKLLTNPQTVNWLASVPTAQMQKGGLAAHLGRLAGLAAKTSDNALATAIDSYLSEVGYSKD